jgi:hypothetical protein
MTPEQVTKLKGRMLALIGAGIASLYMAYQYAQPVVGRGEPPPAFAPYLFGGIGIVCLIVAALMWRKVRNQNVPAATTDLSGPQGKIVILLLVLGVITLAGSYFVDYVVHDENLGLVLSIGLLVIMIVCFLIAGRIGRNIRRNTASTGAVKE